MSLALITPGVVSKIRCPNAEKPETRLLRVSAGQRTWRAWHCGCTAARGPCSPAPCCSSTCPRRRRRTAAGTRSRPCCWPAWAGWRSRGTPCAGRPASSRTETISSGQVPRAGLGHSGRRGPQPKRRFCSVLFLPREYTLLRRRGVAGDVGACQVTGVGGANVSVPKWPRQEAALRCRGPGRGGRRVLRRPARVCTHPRVHTAHVVPRLGSGI